MGYYYGGLMQRIAGCCALVMVVVSHLFGQLSSRQAVEARVAAETEMLMQADREFDSTTAKNRLDGWTAYFAENGSMLPGAGMPISGIAAIRKAMADSFGDSTFEIRWRPTEAGIIVPHMYGYTVGRSEIKRREKEGRRMIHGGMYLSIWKRQNDGTWKIVLDTSLSKDSPVVE